MKQVIVSHKGFSLVELAISVVVVGLLIGLAVKGAEVLENAKVASTVLQAKSLNAGITGFRSEFHSWPGDFAQAQDYIENCTDANNCFDGDGNGVVALDNATLDPGALASMIGVPETLSVWKQMVYAGYGAGIPSGNNPDFGDGLPAASIGGGFEMYYDDAMAAGGMNLDKGHFLRLSREINNAALTAGQGFDGYIAYTIDAKIDDGDISGGDVAATGITGGACAETDVRNCIVFVRVGGI